MGIFVKKIVKTEVFRYKLKVKKSIYIATVAISFVLYCIALYCIVLLIRLNGVTS